MKISKLKYIIKEELEKLRKKGQLHEERWGGCPSTTCKVTVGEKTWTGVCKKQASLRNTFRTSVCKCKAGPHLIDCGETADI